MIPNSSGSPSYTRVVLMRPIDDGTGRTLVPDLRGRISIVDEQGNANTYHDVKAVVGKAFKDSPGLGTGLSAVAVHPNFANNGKFYTAHSEDSGSGVADFEPPTPVSIALQGVVIEWTADDPSANFFTGTRRELMRIDIPGTLHGMQDISFNPYAEPGNPDYGMLYICIGDGGSMISGHPENTGRKDSVLGTVLRIDPFGNDSANGQYGIPDDNPWVKERRVTKEIWAYGFRNPHRISFDLVPLGDDEQPAWVEQGGVVMIEAENLPIKGDWSIMSDQGNFEGEGYIEFRPGNPFSGAVNYAQAHEVLFTVRFSKPGDYQLFWRNQGPATTEHNDSWFNFPGGTMWKEKSNVQFSVTGPIKVYNNSGPVWSWATKTTDNDPHSVWVEIPTPGDYVFAIGGRSTQHKIDRVALVHRSVSSYMTHASSVTTAQAARAFVADIGERNIEEVNLIVPGGNHGWPDREGYWFFDRNSLDDGYTVEPLPGDETPGEYVYPVAMYDHHDGRSIAGGFVYRGNDIPELYGYYLAGDIVSGRLFMVDASKFELGSHEPFQEFFLQDSGGVRRSLLNLVRQRVSGANRADVRFGTDAEGELYILTKQDGKIRKLSSLNPPVANPFPGEPGMKETFLGTINDSLFPWIETDRGYFWVASSSLDDLWLYNSELDLWFWTTEGYHPWFYLMR